MEACAHHGITSLGAQTLWAVRFEAACAVSLFGLWLLGRLAGPKGVRRKARQCENKCDGEALEGKARLSAKLPPRATSSAALGASPSPAQLRDPKFMAEYFTRTCQPNFHRALSVYRSALGAGLDMRRLSDAELGSVCLALVTSAIRNGSVGEPIRIFQDLHKAELCVPQGLFGSAVKLFTSKQLFAEALAIYDFAATDRRFCIQDSTVWSCLLFCNLEAGDHGRCTFLFEQLKTCGAPSAKDYGNMMRFAAGRSDWELGTHLVREMEETGVGVDRFVCNSALNLCISAHRVLEAQELLSKIVQPARVADAITYNIVLKGLVRLGNIDQSFDLFDQMRREGVAASQITYGILVDACVNENLLEKAADLFSIMSREGCPFNTVLYTTMIKAFSRSSQVERAMEVYEKMRHDNEVTLDIVTYTVLVRANCDAARLGTALQLLEDMAAEGLAPDEILFNNILSGCVAQANGELGVKLYAQMLGSGVSPSNATFSILIQLYSQCKRLGDAVEMLATEPQLRGVKPEPRLYLELIQCCVRARQGRRAVEVYEMLTQCCSPTASMHGRILGICAKLHMFDTAEQILSIAADSKLRVNACDANALLEAALRKRKVDSVRGCLKVIQQLDIKVEHQIVSQVRACAEGGA